MLRPRLRFAVPTLVLALLAALVLAPAARAHDVLIATDPADGSTLDSAPAAITLTFSDSPLDVGSAVIVSDSAGDTVVEGPGTVSGEDVVLELGELAAGDYEVYWRVASSDGHPIEGSFAFAVEGAAAPDTTQPAADTTAPDDDATAAPADEATVMAAQPEDTEPDDAEAESTGGLRSLPLWLRVALAVAALAAVAGLVVMVVRRLRDEA